MVSKIKYLFTLPVTQRLTHELEKTEPDVDVVAQCLALKADPMARLSDGSSVFFAIALKRPASKAMTAWFNAVEGQLATWPWRGQPTPLDDVLPYQGVTAQPAGYSLTLLKALHEAGLDIASLDNANRSLVDRVCNTYPQDAVTVMAQLIKMYPRHAFHASFERRDALENAGLTIEWRSKGPGRSPR